jgi:hypothetical protein
MIDFKKLSAFAIVGLVYFLIFAGITYASVQNYDGKEALQNLGQSVLASLATVLANMANSLFKVVLIASALLAPQSAEAGLLDRLRGMFRAPVKAKPAQRYECKNGVCRPVKQ